MYFKGLFINPAKWDGSDFFLSSEHYGIVLTGRAVVALREGKLTNVRLRKMDEIEVDKTTAGLVLGRLPG